MTKKQLLKTEASLPTNGTKQPKPRGGTKHKHRSGYTPVLGKLMERVLASMRKRIVSEGRYIDKKFKVLRWQEDVTWSVLTNSIIGVTMGRGNGKTTFFAVLACEYIEGELTQKRGYIQFVASSLDQARVMFEHVKHFIGEQRIETELIRKPGREEDPEDTKLNMRRRWRLIDNTHQCRITDHRTETMMIGIGSDAKRAHGRAPLLVLADEPAQWAGEDGNRKLYNALSTGLGKQVNSRMCVLGTLSENYAHWFNSEIVDGSDEDTGTAVHVYRCEDDDDVLNEDNWHKANPSLRHMPDLLKEIRRDAKQAEKGGDSLGSFRALRCNMGTPEVSGIERIVRVEDWNAVARKDVVPGRKGPVAIGLDLGGGTSMTGIAFYWPETGWLEVYAGLPAIPSLKDRGVDDGVGSRYQKMENEGTLRIYPGVGMNNIAFLRDHLAMVKDYEVLNLVSDAFKIKDVKQAVLNIEREWKADFRRVGRGLDGSYDIRAFQADVNDAHMYTRDTLLLRSAILESKIHRDDNNNPGLMRRRRNGRNDALQAAVLAVGCGRRWRIPEETDVGWDFSKALKRGIGI